VRTVTSSVWSRKNAMSCTHGYPGSGHAHHDRRSHTYLLGERRQRQE
jgi:hypothetical protein